MLTRPKFNNMIATIIVIGLCLNFLMIVSAWASSKGPREAFSNLMSKLLALASADDDLKQANEEPEFEFKLAPLEDQPAVSVFCPLNFASSSHPQAGARNGSSRKPSLAKKLLSAIARRLGNTKLARGCMPSLPGPRGLDTCPWIDPAVGPAPASSGLCMQEPSVKGKRGLPRSEHKDSNTSNLEGQPRESRRQPRSRLAVRLEKKMEGLLHAIEAAASLQRTYLLNVKLEKLERQHSKRSANFGKTVLSAIQEVDSN